MVTFMLPANPFTVSISWHAIYHQSILWKPIPTPDLPWVTGQQYMKAASLILNKFHKDNLNTGTIRPDTFFSCWDTGKGNTFLLSINKQFTCYISHRGNWFNKHIQSWEWWFPHQVSFWNIIRASIQVKLWSKAIILVNVASSLKKERNTFNC